MGVVHPVYTPREAYMRGVTPVYTPREAYMKEIPLYIHPGRHIWRGIHLYTPREAYIGRYTPVHIQGGIQGGIP